MTTTEVRVSEKQYALNDVVRVRSELQKQFHPDGQLDGLSKWIDGWRAIFFLAQKIRTRWSPARAPVRPPITSALKGHLCADSDGRGRTDGPSTNETGGGGGSSGMGMAPPPTHRRPAARQVGH